MEKGSLSSQGDKKSGVIGRYEELESGDPLLQHIQDKKKKDVVNPLRVILSNCFWVAVEDIIISPHYCEVVKI